MPLIWACVFVLWKLLLCQQFVLLHNGVLHNHHATHQECHAQSSKRIPTIPYLSQNVIKIPKSPLIAHNTLCVYKVPISTLGHLQHILFKN
jgi:hypothetical protein